MSRRVWAANVIVDGRIASSVSASSEAEVRTLVRERYPTAPQIIIYSVPGPYGDGGGLRGEIQQQIVSLGKAAARTSFPAPARLTMMAVAHNLRKALDMRPDDQVTPEEAGLGGIDPAAMISGPTPGQESQEDRDHEATMLDAMHIIDDAAAYMHGRAVDTGFYDDVDGKDPRHVACVAGLTAGEVRKMIETLRAPAVSTAPRIGPAFTHEEEEAADVFIRHLDYCAWRELRLGAAVVAKLEANKGRGHRHGRKRF